MSTVLLTEQTTPATPTTNKVRIFVNSSGTLCSVDDTGTVSVYSAGVTPEQVQDIIGGILVDTASVDLVYNDVTNAISATVLPAGVNHNALQNYVANQHVDHSTVSISAGAGLSGGGDITASRTISMPNTGTAGTYRSVTTDAQGRVTAGTNPTTLAGYGITDAQPLDADLTAVAGLAGTGVVVRTGTGTATTRTVTAGAGITLSNGDGVSGNPTVSITNAITAGSAGSATQVPAITYNAQGLLTAITPTAVNHDALLNFVANKHVDHSAVSITAGTGLSGGGDLTATRTLNLANTTVVPGTYGSVTVYPVITVDQQGRLTTVTTQSVLGGVLTARNNTQYSNTSNVTLTNITEMSIILAANTTYLITGLLIYSSVISTTGLAVSFGGGTVTPTSTIGYAESSITTTTIDRLNFISHTTVSVFSSSAVANQNKFVDFKLIVVVGATGGTFIPQFRSGVNTSTVTVRPNCFIEARVI